MYIATRVLGHHDNLEAIDDESVLVREINVIKGMVNANSDWMAIATTPQQARRIILEGKLCVILGVEADVFGNFKSSDCRWDENARRQDAGLTLINGANANEQLEAKLNQYWEMGLRQILPIHYLSKPFGGAAVFNGNTFLPQISFYGNVRVKTGIPDRIGFSLYEDFPTGPAFVGNFLSYADYAGRVLKQDEGTETSMVNADGLTNEGRILFRKLMKKGFIVDQEHASYQSKRDIFRIAFNNGNYPVIASHCGPEGLSFIWTGAPVRFNGNDQDKIRNFGTSTIRYVSHEMELNDESIQGIKNTNGTIGVFMVSNHKRQYLGRWGSVPNDCPSSTKTMAQMFLYTLDKMDGHGVGLASDLPMVDALCPRFGPYAAWGLMEEKDDALKKNLRTTNRMAQTKGVKYDVASRTYYNELFQGGEIDGFEEDVWKALAAWDAGVNAVVDESKVALSGEPGHGGRIRNMVKGLNANSQDQLLRPCITCGDAPWEQAAMFCLNKGVDPMSLSVYDAIGQRDVSSMFNKILPVWNLWKEKNGGLHPNDPLRRCITGNRYWDFNLDGFAHYGLLPDLLQDLKNIGFTQRQLKPLFTSAEDYIKMWEIAEKKKFDVRE
jgi:microsomal dipeptidase-like Zn-dependent dipeptidase